MKRIAWFTLTGLLVNDANAALSLSEREHVQSIVWTVEALSLIALVAVFWIVWRISKRAKQNKKPGQKN